MVSIACLGHWYAQLLFAVPSVGVIAVMGRDSLRKRWSRRGGGGGPSAPSPGRRGTVGG